MNEKEFTLTEAHIDLLSEANIRWSDVEYGAPGIDEKRPFGNSVDIEGDMCKALDLNPDDEECIKYAKEVYSDIDTALQIILRNSTFKPGTFEADAYSSNWSRVVVSHDGECPTCGNKVSLSSPLLMDMWKCGSCGSYQPFEL